MYNYYNFNDVSSGMAHFNSMPVNNWFGQTTNNNNYATPSYGYAYGEPTCGYVPPAPDVTFPKASGKAAVCGRERA